MEIRRSTPADARQIALLEKYVFPDAWSEKDIVSLISTEGSMCYCALSDGQICCYILGRKIAPEGEIYRIATLPEKRRKGIAYRLLDYVVKNESKEGLENLFLEVREQNIPARKLYATYGFREVGIRKNYYKAPNDNAVIMLLSSGC